MESIMQLLWTISWQAAIFAAIVWLISRLAGKAPASWRYALWIFLLLKFFVPPFAYLPAGVGVHVTPTLPAMQSSVSPMRQPTASQAVSSATVAPSSALPTVALDKTSHLPSWQEIIVLSWTLGMLIMIGILMTRCMRLNRVIRSSVEADENMKNLLASNAEVVGTGRVPNIRLSGSIRTPMLTGLLRPVILLPLGIGESCSDKDLSAILLHELAHVKRWDAAGLWLHQIASVVFFFHPAVWLAGKEMRRERELACDELVLAESSVTRQEYAAGYLSALRLASGVSGGTSALAMAEPFDIEKKRLHTILNKPLVRLTAGWIIALLIVAGIGLVTFAGVRSPQVAALVPSYENVPSYHLKCKQIASRSGQEDNVIYLEYWYQSPSDWKTLLTLGGSKTMQVVANGVSWWYREGSGVAIETPFLDYSRSGDYATAFAPPSNMLKRFGKHYRHVGKESVGNRECEVLEGQLPHGSDVREWIDTKTGIRLKRVVKVHGKVENATEAVIFEVDKPMPANTIAFTLPPNTRLIKSPLLSRGLAWLDTQSLNAVSGNGVVGDPYEESTLQRLVNQAAAYKSHIRRLYEPAYLPSGYKVVSAGSYGRQQVTSDGTIHGAYDTIYIEYINPQTGNVLFLTESADKLCEGEGREISQDGLSGRLVTHNDPFPYVEFFWQSGDVYLKLSGTLLSDLEVMKIAKSLQLLSNVPIPTRTPNEAELSRKPAVNLEFRLLRFIKNARHPNAKYTMSVVPGKEGDTYKFADENDKPVDAKHVINESPLILTGADLLPVTTCTVDSNRIPVINIQFTREGTKKFTYVTRTNIGECLAIVLDGRILSAPRINEPILSGQAVISGGFKSLDEARHLADSLNANPRKP